MTVKENLLRTIAHDSPDHVPYYTEGSIQFVSYRGGLPPDNGTDLWGVTWKKEVDEILPYAVEHPVKAPSDLAHYIMPEAGDPGLFEELRATIDSTENLVVGCHYGSLFERLCSLCGTENALVWILEETDAVAEFVRRLADWHLEIAERFVALGVEAGRISDDYGSQQNLLMSPSLWRQVIRPALSRVVAFYKQAGCLVFLHSCGNIGSIFGDLVDLGINVFNIQTATNDLASLKREYGERITFMGGLDTLQTMTRGTPEMVSRQVQEAIKALGEGGGLILEPDQRITMPAENVTALVDAARRHGKYT